MLALLAALLALSPAELRTKAAAGLSAIRPEAIAAHVRFLADDLLEGRRSGERGHAIAERYVAAQFEALGLRPAGERQGWLQEVRLRELRADPDRSSLSFGGGPELRPFEDYLPGADTARTEVEIDAPLVFVGYGVRAPELGYDDTAGVDLAGKIVVWLQGAPGTPFPPLAKAVYSDSAVKWLPLAGRGAVGILALLTPERLQIQPFDRAAHAARRGTVVSSEAPPMPPVVAVQPDIADALLAHAASGLSDQLGRAREGKLRAFDIGVRARIRLASAAREITSHNVLGLLPATEAGGKEIVVISAHLDHLGIGDPVDGDAIYNGAVDNATGIAEMLELARALAAQPDRKRAVLFLAATGEELGLHGSAWFTRHPTVPLQDVVANLNLDQLSPMWTPHDVVLRGAEQSTLEDHVRVAAALLGLSISPDPVPEQTFFLRSDQYNFARHGIPAACLWQGFRDDRGGSTNEAIFRRWRTTRYHQPSDDLRQPLDWGAAAAWARFEFLVALSLVQADARPAWKPDDFFTKFLTSHRPP
jgi:peptidase M28-like protein